MRFTSPGAALFCLLLLCCGPQAGNDYNQDANQNLNDNGNNVNFNPAHCGNGIINPGEQCDDGNARGCDGCSELCQLEPGACCGNGLPEQYEECDDGNTVEGDGCNNRCELEYCGNGRIDEGEICDDGNTDQGDGCNHVCLTEICGNGVVDASEMCDGADFEGESCATLGYHVGDLVCTAGCAVDSSDCSGRCGDGIIDAGYEDCDGTTAMGSTTCQSLGWNGGEIVCDADCQYDDSVCSDWYFWDTFEDAGVTSGQWTMSGNWSRGSPPGTLGEPTGGYSSSNCLGTAIGTDYANGVSRANNMVMTGDINLVGATAPQATFRVWWDFEGSVYDGGNLWVSTNGGGSWTQITAVTPSYNGSISCSGSAWNSTNRSWNAGSADLSAYVGQTIRLAFAMCSDGSVTYTGLYIDELLVAEPGVVP